MLPGLSAAESARFFERVSATAIANQATLKCCLEGMPLTVDNVILFVGDFVEPEHAEATGLFQGIMGAIQEVLDCKGMMSRVGAANDMR
ncbi:hypothetical protein N7E02_04480 (plasmid) [Aliirhizobium terrae]|uniref:hypothetical protein n=1 Tax=Terrirhizobium terrae TaxID=2926709 RepID=UPI0025781959|nr:hypothetical protein [Rhizobium sp. CC-CFT758]WJH38650.1 hypothetical protein N7E02_04480 [Rhizobium sp. CC-CFT758]